MANGNFEVTHKKIYDSALEMFLENGFERTNLRDLCKNAGVTTGAFYRHYDDKSTIFNEIVKPAIDGINAYFNERTNKYIEEIQAGKNTDLFGHSVDRISRFIRFIYDNFKMFKLLLEGAEGTQYANFLDLITEKEDELTFKAIEILTEKGVILNTVKPNEVHMLDHAYFACIFEVVLHQYSIEDALDYAKTIVTFFCAGWDRICLGK